METKKTYSTTGSAWKSLLMMLPMLLLIFIFTSGGKPNFHDPLHLASFLVAFGFFGWLFFMILYTGQTNRYRTVGFVVLALFFALTFVVNLITMRGSMAFASNNVLSCEIPFCHIVTTMVIIPAAITKTIIFPGSILDGFAAIASMLVIVAGISISIGRGFCSWGCFYGGWDCGFSSVARKPIIKKVNPSLKWMSFAVLVVVALSSAATLSPTYCDWLCPFKTVTEYEKVTSVEVFFKTLVFLSLFVGLVVVLPLLTKKRIQCTTLCPMGALLSLTNRINIFGLRIDKDRCISCKRCVKACPTLSIGDGDVEKGRPSMTCTKCGRCIDVCPKDAIHYHVKGTPANRNFTLNRMLFLYPAFTLLVIFTAGPLQQGIRLLVKLITTGSLI
jgi:ferredoxin-type protein NapH